MPAPDLVASVRLEFGVAPDPVTFSLEVDAADSMLNSPVNVEPATVFNWFWRPEQFDAFYKGKEILKVTADGYTHVRLYAPEDMAVEVFATEIPVAIKAITHFKLAPGLISSGNSNAIAEFTRAALSFEDMTKHPFAVPVLVSPPKPAPPSVEFVGTKEAAVLDTIEFQSQRIAHMRYNYEDRGIETVFVSAFRNDAGEIIDKPIWKPELNGAFVLKEAGSGSIVVRYPVRYRLYKINYGLPSGLEYPALQLAWLRGDITQFPMPPVQVIAVAKNAGRLARASFEKKVFPAGAGLATWSTKGFEEVQAESTATVLTEKSRKTQSVTVIDGNNPENTITFSDTKEITLFDSAGRPFTLRLN